MADTFEQGGVIYRDNGDGTVTIVGYQDAPIAPQDPRIDPSARKTQADTETENATRPATVAKGQREAATAGLPAGYMWEGQRAVPIPGYTPAGTTDPKASQKMANINALVQQINRVQELYNENLKGMGLGQSIMEYLPTQANSQFDAAGAGLAEQGLAAFRVPGVGAQSDTELRQFVQANKPSASSFDSANEERLRQLRSRVDQTRAELGLPAADWQGLPEDEKKDRNALTIARLIEQDPLVAAGFGSPKGSQPIPPEMQQEHSAFIAQGGFTPAQYAQFRASLDQKYGFPTPDANKLKEYEQVAPEILKVLQQGGDIGQIPPAERVLSRFEQVQNSAVNNPGGGALAGFTNMMSLGGVEGLAGDQYGALRESQGVPVLLGEILGAVAGAEGLGAIGRNTLGRAAPSLLGGGGRAQMARNLATDTTFGAGYGGVTEGDPLSGAGYSALGSVGGQYVGKGVGAGIRGAAASGPARTLKDAGVRLTGGQLIGGPMKAIEDRMMSVPILGDIVRNRRVEGMQDFNRAAFNEAGQPIGATVADTGREGLDQLNMAVTQAYDDATRGVNVQLDPQFKSDMAKVAQARDTLPPDYAARFDKVGENRIGPIVNAGEMTGETYQQSMRGLKGSKASASGAAPGFEQEYKDALSQAMDVIDAQMQRGGGSQVVEGLGKANETYKRFKTLKDAMDRGIGGSQSGEVGLFTPNQLQQAGKATERKFGDRPFSQLADAGQSVLPSQIPDSGTAGRLAQLALPGALAGGGGLGYAASGDVGGATTGAGATLTLGAMLSLMATKQGQAAVRAILSNRNDATRRAGQIVGERAGLLGHAAIPLVN